MKKVILITINFHSEEETHGCLDSLKNIDISGLQFEIIVVDNGSIKKFILSQDEQKRKIQIIRNDNNLGFSGGNNVGILKALSEHPDYLVLLNNDTYVDKEFLQELIKTAESNGKIGLVSPKIYFAKGSEYHKDRYQTNDLGHVFWYAGGKTDWQNVGSVHRGMDEVDNGQYNNEEEVQFATGCCMLLSMRVLEKIKGFDEKYFLYFEDADLNERVKKAGYIIFYAPKSIVWHINAASSGVGSKLHDYFLTRNRLLFGFTYAPLRTKFALFRESIRLLFTGREWQKIGIQDYYTKRFGKGRYR